MSHNGCGPASWCGIPLFSGGRGHCTFWPFGFLYISSVCVSLPCQNHWHSQINFILHARYLKYRQVTCNLKHNEACIKQAAKHQHKKLYSHCPTGSHDSSDGPHTGITGTKTFWARYDRKMPECVRSFCIIENFIRRTPFNISLVPLLLSPPDLGPICEVSHQSKLNASQT